MRALRCLIAAGTLVSSVPAVPAAFSDARTITGASFNADEGVTIVHYWATWCAPCRLEMPVLDAYYRRHHGQGLQMLAISIDQGASDKKLQRVTSSFAFPVARVEDVKVPRRDIPTALPVTRVLSTVPAASSSLRRETAGRHSTWRRSSASSRRFLPAG